MILDRVENLITKIFEAGISPKKTEENPKSNLLLLGQAAHPYNPKRWEPVSIPDQEFKNHFYAIGGSGSGKTKLIESIIRQLIQAGKGFGILDPHGDLCDNILNYLAFLASNGNQSAILEYFSKKLILVEPFNPSGIIGFNPLEARKGESFYLATELMGIFKKTWQDAYWGPRMEELLRNSLVTLSENGLTLLEVAPLLTSPLFREKVIQKLGPGEVRDYWLTRYNALSEKMQAVYREPVLNRISIFTSDPCIRLMVGQQKSTVNFRRTMDKEKWLSLKMSKGHLGKNTYLLGGFYIAKMKMAAMTRIDMPERDRKLFIMAIDEFQNFAGKQEDFETILSEARKMGLGLCLAHQTLEQIDRDLRASILGNVTNQIYFRLSHHDAAQISSEIDQKEKALIERRLIDFKVGQACFKKKGEKARMIQTAYVPEIKHNEEMVQVIKNISFSNFARPKKEIEEEIQKRQAKYFSRDKLQNEGIGNRAPLSPYNEELDEGWDG
jgi:hypothetical protein